MIIASSKLYQLAGGRGLSGKRLWNFIDYMVIRSFTDDLNYAGE